MSDILQYLEGAEPEQPIVPKHQWCAVACKNGAFFDATKSLFNVYNSLINRSLGFSEELICSANEPYMWLEHYSIIIQSVRALFGNDAEFPSADDLRRKIEIFISKNHYPSFSLIRLIVWQSEDNMTIEWAMLQEKMQQSPYDFRRTSLVLSVFSDSYTPRIPNPWIKMPSIIGCYAERWIEKKAIDGACIVNYEERIIDTTAGNLYLLIDKDFVGVNPLYGAHYDALTSIVERIVPRIGLTVRYVDGMTAKMFDQADEALVVSATSGVRCVVGIDNRRYSKQVTEKIAMLVSDYFIGA